MRALTEELKRRKIQADKLKKERKKRRKDILKNKEEALKKQIEVGRTILLQELNSPFDLFGSVLIVILFVPLFYFFYRHWITRLIS